MEKLREILENSKYSIESEIDNTDSGYQPPTAEKFNSETGKLEEFE